jgi:hypothetical protein
VGANFSNADFTGANLTGGEFDRSNFVGADLTGATARGAVFGASDMRGAVLRRVDLRSADLSRVRNLSQAQLDQACGNNETQAPQGLVVRECGSHSRVRTFTTRSQHGHVVTITTGPDGKTRVTTHGTMVHLPKPPQPPQVPAPPRFPDR